MRMKLNKLPLFALSAFALVWAYPTKAESLEQTGKLKVHVEPKQAYVFVDGKAIRDGSQTIHLTPGKHTVSVHNYGYTAQTEAVQIDPAKATNVSFDLQRSGDKVSGPFADLEFKGDPRAAVFLNGNTPSFFVGHVDEFDWDWIWHQRLLIQPGSYHVTVKRKGDTIWSGDVTAKAGQKVIVYLNQDGKTVTKNWRPGTSLGPQPRFHAGIASATVPVAPVTSELTASSSNLACGQSTTLNWGSSDAVNTSISGLGAVPGSGDRAVSPTRDTTYTFQAIGPGGKSTKTLKVDVNAEPTAELALSQPEIRYHKIGDKVVEQGSTTLSWSAQNADSATVRPFGSEEVKGSRTILADPNQSMVGPVDEDVTYTLTASNPCGGTITKEATVHIAGSIDPPPTTTLASLFYPTAYPTRKHPKSGLVPSEKAVLDRLAAQFKNFGDYESHAQLTIVGFADTRGSEKYNQALSLRRAVLAKDYLVAKGVPAAELNIEAKGKQDQIALKTVEALQAKDAQRPEKWMRRDNRATWLAYNRRVDIVLEPTGQQSTRSYPNDAVSAHLLWQRPIPSLKALARADSNVAGNTRASLSAHGS
jgi:hypothetical protein